MLILVVFLPQALVHFWPVLAIDRCVVGLYLYSIILSDPTVRNSMQCTLVKPNRHAELSLLSPVYILLFARSVLIRSALCSYLTSPQTLQDVLMSPDMQTLYCTYRAKGEGNLKNQVRKFPTFFCFSYYCILKDFAPCTTCMSIESHIL